MMYGNLCLRLLLNGTHFNFLLLAFQTGPIPSPFVMMLLIFINLVLSSAYLIC